MRPVAAAVFVAVLLLALAPCFCQCPLESTQDILPEYDTIFFPARASMDGNFLALSDEGIDASFKTVLGRVHVYEWDGTSWGLQQTLVNPPESPLDDQSGFGSDLVLHDDRLVVGEPGAITIYQRVSGIWGLEQRIEYPASFAGQWVDYDGETIAVAYRNPPRALLYEHDGVEWVETQAIDPPEGYGSGGREIAVLGDDLMFQVVSSTSSVLLHYERQPDGIWTLVGPILPPDGPSAFFASAIDLDSGRMVVGSWLEDTTLPNTGAAYVFEQGPGGWEFTAELTPEDVTEGALFGIAVSVDGDRIVVGATRNLAGTPEFPGQAFLFELIEGDWVRRQLFVPGLEPVAAYGQSVEVDGHRVVVTSLFEDTGDPARTGVSRYFDVRPEFLRGDCNRDDVLDIADGIFLISALFLGGPVSTCAEACDSNDDGLLDVGDAVGIFNYFLGIGESPVPPAAPFPDPGRDEDLDPHGCSFLCP